MNKDLIMNELNVVIRDAKSKKLIEWALEKKYHYILELFNCEKQDVTIDFFINNCTLLYQAIQDQQFEIVQHLTLLNEKKVQDYLYQINFISSETSICPKVNFLTYLLRQE